MPPKKLGEKKNTKKPSAHPPYIEMIKAAITALKERSGSSRQAILKHILSHYKNLTNPQVHLKMALKRGVASGKLVHSKGIGASGSFRLAAVKPTPVRKQAAPKRTTAAGAKRKAKPAARKRSVKTTKSPSKKKKSGTPQKKKTAARRTKPATPKRSLVKKRVVKKAGGKKGKK